MPLGILPRDGENVGFSDVIKTKITSQKRNINSVEIYSIIPGTEPGSSLYTQFMNAVELLLF